MVFHYFYRINVSDKLYENCETLVSNYMVLVLNYMVSNYMVLVLNHMEIAKLAIVSKTYFLVIGIHSLL